MDLNNLAWSYLLANRVSADAIELGRRAAGAGGSYGTLHTLASLYAELGMTTEAHQIILQAMGVAIQEEPSASTWYVFGRIAEQYGLKDVALSDYAKVDKPATEDGLPASTWALAQRRNRALASGN